MKICPVGAEFHAEGQTNRRQKDMTKLKSLFAILRARLKIPTGNRFSRFKLNTFSVHNGPNLQHFAISQTQD